MKEMVSRAWVLSGSEMQLLAAAAGLHKLHAFSIEPLTKNEAAQCAFSLLKRGLLIQIDDRFAPSEALQEIFQLIRSAKTAFFAVSYMLAQRCCYIAGEQAVVIAPERWKRGSCRLYVQTFHDLLAELGQEGCLPPDRTADEVDDGQTEREWASLCSLPCLGGSWDAAMDDERVHAVYTRFVPQTGVHTGQMLLWHGPDGRRLIFPDQKQKLMMYRKQTTVWWLEGADI